MKETTIYSLGGAFIIGVVLVGLSVSRTIQVSRGNVFSVCWMTAIHSYVYYVSVYLIAKDRVAEYVATCLGAQLVCVWMAYIEKRRQDAKEELS